MVVAVTGLAATMKRTLRTHLDVDRRGRRGPSIPALPAYLLTNKIHRTPEGARPCVGEVTLPEIEEALTPLRVRTHSRERDAPGLFERALGDEFSRLEMPIRALHSGAIDPSSREKRLSSAEAQSSPASSAESLVFRPPPNGFR